MGGVGGGYLFFLLAVAVLSECFLKGRTRGSTSIAAESAGNKSVLMQDCRVESSSHTLLDVPAR